MFEGRWDGHYEYHDGGPASGRLIKFTLEIRGRPFRRFSGTKEDDPTAGVPEKAALSGWWKGRTISFEMRHARVWTLNEEGAVVLLEDWARKKHGSSVVLPFPYDRPAITYAGISNDADAAVMGTWHAPSLPVNLGSGGSLLLPETFGTFALRRNVDWVYRPQRERK